MENILYVDMTYCTLCDRYFPGEEARAQHVQMSSNHPKCNTCDRRFANKNSLRNHWVYSRRHHYCAVCERDFRTAAGLRVHIEYAAVHRDDSDDDDSDDGDDIDDSAEGWEDELGGRMFPEENDQAIPALGEDGDPSEAEYWTDDERDDFEEEQETYLGFAHLPAGLPGSLTEALGPHRTQPSGNGETTGTTTLPQSAETQDDRVPAPGALFSCPLCLENPQETSATECGHLFCTSCILTALSMKKMCPVCREFAQPRQLRKIYLSAA